VRPAFGVLRLSLQRRSCRPLELGDVAGFRRLFGNFACDVSKALREGRTREMSADDVLVIGHAFSRGYGRRITPIFCYWRAVTTSLVPPTRQHHPALQGDSSDPGPVRVSSLRRDQDQRHRICWGFVGEPRRSYPHQPAHCRTAAQRTRRSPDMSGLSPIKPADLRVLPKLTVRVRFPSPAPRSCS
jgi:hypothetical protein